MHCPLEVEDAPHSPSRVYAHLSAHNTLATMQLRFLVLLLPLVAAFNLSLTGKL
jgi:hypothetical protein